MIWKWSHILLHFAATQHWNKVAYIFHWRKFDIFTLFKVLVKIIGKHHKQHLISIFTINVRLEDMPIKYTWEWESLVSKQYSIYNEISRFYILATLSSTAFNPLLQLPSWTLWSKGINLIWKPYLFSWKRYLFHENDISFMKTIFCKGLVDRGPACVRHIPLSLVFPALRRSNILRILPKGRATLLKRMKFRESFKGAGGSFSIQKSMLQILDL